MKARLCLAVMVMSFLAASGCRHETITPMPGIPPSAAMLVRCDTIPLTRRLQLRRYELLRSDVSNDFYPFNISRARVVQKLLSRLYVWSSGKWQLLDYAAMTRAIPYGAPNLSPDGTRIVYERPDVVVGEGEFPRAYGPERQSHQVAIYDLNAKRKFLLDTITEVRGLGQASHWRPDGQAVAFSTLCVARQPHCRTLMVLDPCGRVLLDNTIMPELLGLEFICYSPDGARIAALRPADASAGAAGGGVLVEVDVEKRSVRTVGGISSAQACKNLERFERLVTWDSQGRCAVAE